MNKGTSRVANIPSLIIRMFFPGGMVASQAAGWEGSQARADPAVRKEKTRLQKALHL